MSKNVLQGRQIGIPNRQLEHLRATAIMFAEETRFVLPSIWKGRPVAHARPQLSRIRNFSTITKVVRLQGGFKVFLIRRYPLSWIHSLTDNLQRWMNGRGGFKPIRTSVWQKRFEEKSLIPIIPLGIKGVVALPYLENYNLHDVLFNRVLPLSFLETQVVLLSVASRLNYLHETGVSWGEPIVHNMIIDPVSLEPTICDTEVKYLPHLSQRQGYVRDWWDFIMSASCAYRGTDEERAWLADTLTRSIADRNVREDLRKLCRQDRTWKQKLFWSGMLGLISFVNLKTYNAVRQAISRD